jgi:hypothetical protein
MISDLKNARLCNDCPSTYTKLAKHPNSSEGSERDPRRDASRGSRRMRLDLDQIPLVDI